MAGVTPATLFDSFLYRYVGIKLPASTEQQQGTSAAKRDILAVSHFFNANLFSATAYGGLTFSFRRLNQGPNTS